MSLIRWARERVNFALIGSGLPAWRDRRVLHAQAAAAGDGLQRRALHHVLVAAPGAGNIGDQALFEAFVENVDGDIVVVARSVADVEVPEAHRSRLTVVALDALLYGRGAPHRRDLMFFAELLRDAATVSIVGADVMDGRYSPRAASNRWNIARAAAEQGVYAQILGFSWNGAPRRSARRSLIAASRSGVVLLLRDPVSADRVRSLGVAEARETSDIVFSARTVEPVDLLASVRAAPYALVNVSALVGEGLDQSAEIVTVIEHLLEQGQQVILLPHVSRPGGDDIPLCIEAAETVNDPRVHLVDRLLSPGQIRTLGSEATVVVTGRMHLAVMSLWSGVPAITLSTQGKVAGLMQLMDAPELCVEPLPGFGARIVAVLDRAMPADSDTRKRIAAALPEVKDLAALNTREINARGGVSRPVSQK